MSEGSGTEKEAPLSTFGPDTLVPLVSRSDPRKDEEPLGDRGLGVATGSVTSGAGPGFGENLKLSPPPPSRSVTLSGRTVAMSVASSRVVVVSSSC